MKRKVQTRTKQKGRRAKRKRTLKSKARQEKGLGTEIAELFRGIGLRPGEEIPELRFIIEPPDFGE